MPDVHRFEVRPIGVGIADALDDGHLAALVHLVQVRQARVQPADDVHLGGAGLAFSQRFADAQHRNQSGAFGNLFTIPVKTKRPKGVLFRRKYRTRKGFSQP